MNINRYFKHIFILFNILYINYSYSLTKCNNIIYHNNNNLLIYNLSNIYNSIGILPLSYILNGNNNDICKYNVATIKNNNNIIVKFNRNELINIIFINKFNNYCKNNGFCYNMNDIINLLNVYNIYPFIEISYLILPYISYDNIQGCNNMNTLYKYIKFILTSDIAINILKNYSYITFPINYIIIFINKLDTLKCYYNLSYYEYIKDINNYSNIIITGGSSLQKDIHLELSNIFYELYNINIIYKYSNSLSCLETLINNELNIILCGCDYIDKTKLNNNILILPFFLTPIMIIYNLKDINNLILNINDIINIFSNNLLLWNSLIDNHNYIIIHNRDNYSGTILSFYELFNISYNDLSYLDKCKYINCDNNINNSYIIYDYKISIILIIILIIIFIIIIFIIKKRNTIKYINIKNIIINNEDLNKTIIKSYYHYNIVILKNIRICNRKSLLNINNKYKIIKNINKFYKLDHPNIIKIIGLTTLNNNINIIYPYFNLGSLSDIINNSILEFDNITILNTLIKICDGLLYINNNKLIHGNLKLSNILINNSYDIKLTDFNDILFNNNIINDIYKPVETINYGIINEYSDIYAFGMIIYGLIYFKEPYYEYSIININDIIDPNILLRPTFIYKLDDTIETLITECWNNNYKLRPNIIKVKERLIEFNKDYIIINKKIVDKIDKLNNILLDNFPEGITSSLLYNINILPINYDNMSILLLDICNYTNLCSTLSNIKIVNMLSRLYDKYDLLIKQNNLIKIGNVGDAYIICSDVNNNNEKFERIVLLALKIIEETNNTYIDEDNKELGTIKIRIGLNNGHIIGHVLGHYNSRFSLYGDTINVASRMESTSEPMRIQCLKDFAMKLISINPNFNIEYRGVIYIKGKGNLESYFINSYNKDILTNNFINNTKELKHFNKFFNMSLKKLINNNIEYINKSYHKLPLSSDVSNKSNIFYII